jgi:hypothetical protein
MSNNNRGASRLRDQTLIAGTEKHLASNRSLAMGTKKVTSRAGAFRFVTSEPAASLSAVR